MKKLQVRQGDCFIESAVIPKEATATKAENGRCVLLRGEATGHHHSVSADDVEMFERDGTLFLRVNTETPLEHQEHAPITLAPGEYVMRRQREYWDDEVRNVAD